MQWRVRKIRGGKQIRSGTKRRQRGVEKGHKEKGRGRLITTKEIGQKEKGKGGNKGEEKTLQE